MSTPSPSFFQGYQILATGPQRYMDMAKNLAASIRLLDPNRRICLVHDQPVPDHISKFFDDFSILPADSRYNGVMNKIRVFDVSPYEQTMFVDADCLLVKGDANSIWQRAATRPFSITGAKASSGSWKGMDIANMLKATGAPYLIRMNSGVFYFDKSPYAAKFFEFVNDLYINRMHEFGFADLRGEAPGQADETYFGLAMGMRGMDTENMENIGINSWSVSTYRTVYSYVNLKGQCVTFKAGGFFRDISFLPTHVVPLSPTFLHFVNLKPRGLYKRLVGRILAKLQEAETLG